jgi:hypothetical protein
MLMELGSGGVVEAATELTFDAMTQNPHLELR